MNDSKFLASNIKVLREESRLSIDEFANKIGVSKDRAREIEEGKSSPYTKELFEICKVLRISEEDILERDILTERMEANKRMKQADSRNTYNWYYGDRKKMLFYILALILIPGVFLLFFLLTKNGIIANNVKEYIAALEEEGIDVPWTIKYYRIVGSYLLATICGMVFMIIELIRRFGNSFRVWYLIIVFGLIPVIIFTGALLLIPYYIYCLYQVIFKRGKN